MSDWKFVDDVEALKRLPNGTRIRYVKGMTFGFDDEMRYIRHNPDGTMDTLNGKIDPTTNKYSTGASSIKFSNYTTVEYHVSERLVLPGEPLKRVSIVEDKRTDEEKNICDVLLG